MASRVKKSMCFNLLASSLKRAVHEGTPVPQAVDRQLSWVRKLCEDDATFAEMLFDIFTSDAVKQAYQESQNRVSKLSA